MPVLHICQGSVHNIYFWRSQIKLFSKILIKLFKLKMSCPNLSTTQTFYVMIFLFLCSTLQFSTSFSTSCDHSFSAICSDIKCHLYLKHPRKSSNFSQRSHAAAPAENNQGIHVYVRPVQKRPNLKNAFFFFTHDIQAGWIEFTLSCVCLLQFSSASVQISLNFVTINYLRVHPNPKWRRLVTNFLIKIRMDDMTSSWHELSVGCFERWAYYALFSPFLCYWWITKIFFSEDGTSPLDGSDHSTNCATTPAFIASLYMISLWHF